MPYVQLIDLLGIAALLLGTLVVKRPPVNFYEPTLWSKGLVRPLRSAALLLGTVGVIGYLFSVYSSGGFMEVYSVSHNREGLGVSGYIRNLSMFLIPAILLLFLSSSGRRLKPLELGLIAFFAAPIIIRSILAGARGPTFVILVTLVVGWYMSRGTRPPLTVVLGGGMALAFLVLFFVTHRDVLHLGAQFEYKGIDEAIEFMERDSRGHEYIYGSGTIINAIRTEDYEWGGRYIVRIIIRAIPSFLWPSQYEDAQEFLGLPQARLTAQVATLGWSATGGASTGLIADLWRQCWWYYLLVLYSVGWVFGIVWNRAVSRGGIWFVGYVLLVAMSLYLTQQTIQAWLWQIFFLGGTSWIVWRWKIYPWLQKIQAYIYAQQHGMLQ